MPPLDDLPRLLERLYDAAMDPHKWPEFVDALPESFGNTCDDLGVPLFNGHRIAPHASIQAKHSKEYVRPLAILTPHLMRAAEINRALAGAGARHSNMILASTLDGLGRSMFVLDRHCKVLVANTHAQLLMRSEDCPIRVDHLRVLRAGRCGDERLFSASVTAIACASQRAILPLRLASNRTGATYLAWLMPIAPPTNEARSQHQSLVENIGNERKILLLVLPVRRSVEIPPEAIRAAFGLSSAEARLASALVAGCTIGDYAAKTGVSRNTVRNQLIAVFDQMGTRRLTELVATIVDALGPFSGVQTPCQIRSDDKGNASEKASGSP